MTEGLLGADEELTGEVVGTLFADESSGFAVIELDAGDEGGARCTGPLAALVDGEVVRLVGRWSAHAKYGPTFEAVYYEQVTPTTAAGIRQLLATERFDAVPPSVRDRVVTTFGSATGRVIEHEPERLHTEGGLSTDDAEALHDGWIAGLAFAELVRLVEPAGWPMDVVHAVHASYGSTAADIVRADPYAALGIRRLRFAHVDALARHLGIAKGDSRRLVAGARSVVASARRADGHEHLLRSEAVAAVSQLLKVDRLLATEGVDSAVTSGALAVDELGGEVIVSTPEAMETERRLAEHLVALSATTRSRLRWLRTEDHVVEDALGHDATNGQRAAVRMVFASPVSLLVGGPGTGKTHTIAAVVRIAAENGLDVALSAPTGRAAKRLEEVTSRPAMTIHRMLQARRSSTGFEFRYGVDERLPHDLVVVDEVSMCDTALANSVVSALDDGAHLLMVGDPNQLPSVGPGDVLRDLWHSAVLPIVELTQVHRQAVGSRIVAVANEVLSGDVGPIAGADGDVFLAEERDTSRIVSRVVEAVAERAPAYFGISTEQIQVLAPMYRGLAGVHALNAGLRAALNPQLAAPKVGGFRVGDRVMQTRNDPQRDLANGDVGTVVDLDPRKRELRIGFPRGEVTVDGGGYLTAAWAVTVHKAQGGEWPVVVLVLDRSQRPMLWRNLVYTAVTRAQRSLIIVGQHGALAMAASQDRPRRRRTGLAQRLGAVC